MYNFIIGPCDMDSISACKSDMSEFTEEEQTKLLLELKSISPEFMEWEPDGYYETCIALKAKNYVLWDGKKKTTKGSAFKSSNKESALKELMDAMVTAIIEYKTDTLVDIYHSYIHEALNVKDIKRWSMKKTITESILKCKGWTEEDILSKRLRKNETDVWDAIKHLDDLQAGGKVYCYPTVLSSSVETKEYKNGNTKEKVTQITGLKTIDLWTGDENKDKLLERVYDTISIFASVIDLSQFIDYTKKRNKPLLKELK